MIGERGLRPQPAQTGVSIGRTDGRRWDDTGPGRSFHGPAGRQAAQRVGTPDQAM